MNSSLVTDSQGERRGFLWVTKWVRHPLPAPTPAIHPRYDLSSLVGHLEALALTHRVGGPLQRHFRPQAGIAAFSHILWMGE